jgi:hypothetical protein
MSQQITESARALFTGLIDYAGLFPPAAVSMLDAVINYATYRNSNFKWMLGRFILPASRLDEFSDAARDFFSRDTASAWQLSVLAGEDLGETIRQIEDFNRQNAPHAVCDALEVKAADASQIEAMVKLLPETLTTYFEIPVNKNLAEMTAALAIYNQRAKIRTGGVTSDAFPPAKKIARFMLTCLAANVPFKATAGLHHPVRCVKPLTYEKDALIGTMHGFLNVFLAAAFLRQGVEQSLIQELLEDDWAENFTFSESGVLWRQEYFASVGQLSDLRQKCAISFGSCSFVEPIADLQELDIL